MNFSNTQTILNNSRELGKLYQVRAKLSQPDGGIYKGKIPSTDWSDKFLGDTFQKVIIASDDIEVISDLNEVTALGGWCAIRTRCIGDISKGVINNLVSGVDEKIESIEQLGTWIERAISADQIVEAIGVFNGKNYAAISEVSLWTIKTVKAVEQHFGRNLTTSEINIIKNSIQKAEEKRYVITEKYIKFISNKKPTFRVVTDTEILDDLIEARNKLLKEVNLTLHEMSSVILNNRINEINREESRSEHFNQDILEYIDNSSLVWFMYTGPYLELLKRKGIVQTTYGIIIEPWSHAVTNEAESLFNKKVFGGRNGVNNYLKGINKFIGYVAIDEVSQYNMKKTKISTKISKIPNLLNYPLFSEVLENNLTIGSLDLRYNDAFLLGANYLPYGDNLRTLQDMIFLRDEYKNNRINLKNANALPAGFENARSNYSKKMKELSLKLIRNLQDFYNEIFTI